MPPKVKVTREDIVNTALDVVRKGGVHAMNARTIAALLGCSTQPVFSNFATMEQLRLAVEERAAELFRSFQQREMENGKYPQYKANGMAYIRFAKEEAELFKLFFMCDRMGAPIPKGALLKQEMEHLVNEATGLEGTQKELFHLEMWVSVHGIATMFATGYLELPWELVSEMITHMYQGLRKQYGLED